MEQIPRDIDVAVRAVAQLPKGYAGELSTVYRKAHRRRRRRVAAVATALVLVAGLVGGGLTLRQEEGAYQPAAPSGPAQRLMVPGIGELTPDGSVRDEKIIGGGRYDKVIGLADGRLVAFGPRESEMLLTVELPNGQATQRDIRRETEPVSLVAADATYAYLWRPYGLVAHELTTGLERLVIISPDREADPPSDFGASDVVAGRLLEARSGESCKPLLVDLDSLSAVRVLPLTSLGCTAVTGLRLSPTALRVAVAYRQGTDAVRVAVLSTEDGRVLADRQIMTSVAQISRVSVELAWLDDRNVRGVAVRPLAATDELKLFTIPT